MSDTEIIKFLKLKGNHGAEKAAEQVIANNSLLPGIFQAVDSKTKGLKNASIKTLKIISEKNPMVLYDKFDFFLNLLDSTDKILKWNATFIIGNIAEVDKEEKMDEAIGKLIYQLYDDVMITVANTVGSIWRIAKFKPQLEQRITSNLLKADLTERNEECQRIIAGKTILAFGNYFDKISDKSGVMEYAKRHLNSKRNATKSKADEFIRKYEKPSSIPIHAKKLKTAHNNRYKK
ncbi:MAG: hypothetical protein PF448_07540 [Bacteroidales bacterium]|jgi:hypothetical protein|nr:hypothetical protein [Bacteroidales bacterium]